MFVDVDEGVVFGLELEFDPEDWVWDVVNTRVCCWCKGFLCCEDNAYQVTC